MGIFETIFSEIVFTEVKKRIANPITEVQLAVTFCFRRVC